MHNKYAIIIDCPDEYLDILKIFFLFLNKNWKDRTSTIYITTETKAIDCPKNVVFIECGKGKNSIQRSKCALANIIDDYVMILDCDDFISKAVSNNEIDSLLTYCYENEIKYVRLYKRHNKELRKYKTTLKHLYYCNKKARYCRSLMANIWHKEEYLKLIENDNIDGWEIEKQWLNEALTSKKGCFKDYCYYSNNPLHIVHAVAKGKWIRSAYRFARRNGIPKDMLSQRLRISIPATIKNTLSYMATGILPSWLCFKIKKLTSKIINYKSNY